MAKQSNADYWAKRMKAMEDDLLDQSYSYVENLENQFRAAQAEIERQMSVWYQRFAANNEITFADAKRLLSSDELEEFRWSVEEYIKYGKQNALDGAWMKQLENASAKVHVSRLEALKLQLQQQAESLYANQLDAVDAAAKRAYQGGYYHTAFEIQRGLGVGWTMQSINESTIQKVLSRPWTADGQTFRDRCWEDQRSLVNAVNTQLTQMIIRGEAPDQAIAAISKQFKVAKGKAGRLVMTESAYFASAAQKDCFKELGVERYEIVASFDTDTCELCGALNGKVFKMSEYQVGLTAPPFHPWCRCCTCPYYDDMRGLGERWTRNPDGSTTKVPADMSFDEWRQKFAQGPETGLTPPQDGDTIPAPVPTPTREQQHFSTAIQGMPGMTQDYGEALEARFATGTPVAQSAFAKHVPPGSVSDGAHNGTAFFSSLTQKVKMNFADDLTNVRGAGATFFHEHGHFIDFMSCSGSGWTSLSTPAFGSALRADFDAYIKGIMKQQKITKTAAYSIIAQEVTPDLYSAISDLMGGLSRNKARGNWGHATKYWRGYGALELEAFAHMYEAQFNPDRYALMQKYFPGALAEFENLLKEVI